jgi:stage II sporulation protein D
MSRLTPKRTFVPVFCKRITAAALLAVVVCGPARPAVSQEDRQIRVLIVEGPEMLKLTVMKGYRIIDPKTQKVLAASKTLAGVNVRSREGGLLIAGVKFPESVQVHSAQSADLYIDNKPFRGFISLHRQPDGTLAAVNHIDVEDYLYGVLYHEVGSWWPMEALKAQAVAARTYALHHKKFTSGRRFDVYNNQSSQMYGGADSERSRSNAAVDQTRGEVLTFQGGMFAAYYHAACGGMTRDASELWNVRLAPLSGGVKCETCWFSPHYSWHTKVPLRDMEKLLDERGVRVGSLRDMEVVTRSPSGRVLTASVKGTLGERTINAKDLRLWVGPTVVRSENFELHERWGKIVFEGRGWGHGVGMCQWGALGQSIMGKKYADILGFYYPGATIRKIYS